MMRSIQNRLLILVLGMVLVAGLANAWQGYQRVVHEVDELMDAQLAQYARIMLAFAYSGNDEQVTLPSIQGHPYQSRILFQIWEQDRDGAKLILTSSGVDHQWPIAVASNGYSTALIGNTPWRCFAAQDDRGEHRIWAGLDMQIRDELARDMAFNNLKPYLFGIPVLLFFLVVAVRQGLRPLRSMEKEIRNRTPQRLDPIAENHSPSELIPLIRTMNGLFDRVMVAMENERRFTSDAAHELRTPLAALKVQLQVAHNLEDADQKQLALTKAIRGADRMTHLVGQLLALSRLDSHSESAGLVSFDLSALVEDLLVEYRPLAQLKKSFLPCEFKGEQLVQGNPDLMAILIRNLLDNALRYCPESATVRIQIDPAPDSVRLSVADNGPGVPALDLAKLGQRFQRLGAQDPQGVGLGLSIVQRIAALHGTTAVFNQGLDGRGLEVSIRLARP